MIPTPQCDELGHGITAVDTEFLQRGFDASHLLAHGGRAAFVDTGTTHSVPFLLAALDLAGIARDAVDYVFLTHVHLDHAGGAGALMAQLPNAQAVVHPRGARHMIDPARLVAGATAVYGEELMARHYGVITPIPAERVRTIEDSEKIMLADRELEFLHTRGHAKHHYCIYDAASQGMFTGDSFGVSYRSLDTARGPFIFPTTTPVQFEPEQAHATIDRILSYRPERVYLTHYSRVENIGKLAADLHECLDAFVALALECADQDNRTQALQDGMFAYLGRRLDRHGFPADAVLRRKILQTDVLLNVQGIEVWLDRRAAATGEKPS